VGSLLKRKADSPRIKVETEQRGRVLRFQLRAAEVPQGCILGILGSARELGAWEEDQVVLMDGGNYPIWEREVAFRSLPLAEEYKFVLYDPSRKKILGYEERENRKLYLYPGGDEPQLKVLHEEGFRSPLGKWRGTGVAIPVFSLRSEEGLGVGEFYDLKQMVDWARDNHLKMIQILPINDTMASKSWTDSYPYGAISVFALHPLYLRLEAVGQPHDQSLLNDLERVRDKLNALEEIAYEAVMDVKMAYLEAVYQVKKEKFFDLPSYQDWFESQREWLLPYAVFCALRDSHGTADFSQWEMLSQYSEEEVERFADPRQDHFDKVGLYYFIQYHLHLQLKEASDYARSQGIILKGDIPIGISRSSVDAWTSPELYQMDKQAGAPPDAFAVEGQNWGFPTYNWERMAKNNYAWWRKRMTQMAEYFDAYRIDHILGFFRIWQIPGHAIQGLMGQFNPSLPFSIEELQSRGIWFDQERLTRPYIRWHMLEAFFEEFAPSVVQEFLFEFAYRCYHFKPEFNTQKKVRDYLDQKIEAFPESQWYFERIRKGLYALHAEVIFLEAEGSQGRAFDPRIALHHTYSFRELDFQQQQAIDALYIDYFYRRHEQFWKEQALVKLPALKEATDMLVCGEDLGMVPDCVPEVMRQLGILSLEIQRMPKDSKIDFFHPADAPYLSVVSTSTHDMPTIRGWWEQDPSTSQSFYNTMLGRMGGAPFFCEPWIVEAIVEQHLYAPSMWAVFPIQDLLGMDASVRKENPHSEQINVPANPTHYWRYRMHISLEELMGAKRFNEKMRKLIVESGRANQVLLSHQDKLELEIR